MKDEVEQPPIKHFGWALAALKRGEKVQRSGWNGKGMYLRFVDGWSMHGSKADIPHLPFIVMKTADDCLVPWLCSQTDMLAEDWDVLDES